jgi:MFS family permease
MQIPAGILLDRFGSKKVLIFATIICGIGNIIFISGGYELALFGRLLVGIGSLFAFIGVLKLTLENLSTKYFSIVTSIVISLGTFAAAFSQNISVLISSYDTSWINIFIYSGLIAFPLALLFFLALK